jgi:hypothetical protein
MLAASSRFGLSISGDLMESEGIIGILVLFI